MFRSAGLDLPAILIPLASCLLPLASCLLPLASSRFISALVACYVPLLRPALELVAGSLPFGHRCPPNNEGRNQFEKEIMFLCCLFWLKQIMQFVELVLEDNQSRSFKSIPFGIFFLLENEFAVIEQIHSKIHSYLNKTEVMNLTFS
jgi:hypothetical protein